MGLFGGMAGWFGGVRGALALRNRTLRQDRRGVVAVEMVFLLGTFILCVMATFQLCIYLFVQQAMMSAAQSSARQIQLGLVQAAGNVTTADQFRLSVMCPTLNGMLNCDSIEVAVSKVAAGSDYHDTSQVYTAPSVVNSSTQPPPYCNGGSTDLMSVTAIYMMPVVVPMLFTTTSSFNGSNVVPVTVNVAFMNEDFGSVPAGQKC